MPLTPPTVADLSYAVVERMLRERIPLVAPEWTDHNDSDPGIAMIQLFAHLTDQLGYRLNRVPEKTYIEFLKLVGVTLAPARAAETRIAFTLSKPGEAQAMTLPAGSRIRGKGAGGTTPVFETDAELSVLPVQLAALVTARADLLNINELPDTGPSASGDDPVSYVDQRFSLAWDGKKPKLKDMPLQPVALFEKPEEVTHRILYLGLAFNQIRSAGFLGARADLHLQIDGDQQPEAGAQVQAGGKPFTVANAFEDGPPLVSYSYFRPPATGEAAGSWQPLMVLSDETDGWTRSGTIRLDVPERIGPVPVAAWADVEPDMAHPLIDQIKTPVADTPEEVPISGWLRVAFVIPPQIRVRSLSFNSMTATNLQTVTGERLGRGTGLSAQTMSLANPNVAADSIRIISRDPTRSPEYLDWRQVPDFDASAPGDPVYALDAEAGLVIFGDGLAGRPPFATEVMIAERYRHGGGPDGNCETGAVKQPDSLPTGMDGAFNVIPAHGGYPAETTDQAKRRAPGAFRRRGRAVTDADFLEATLEAPGVRIARATVIPRRLPYPMGHEIDGLDAFGMDFDTDVPGALTVIAVPDQPGPYPMPTTSELSLVARHLDRLRLITTEVHVAAPQYVRLYDMTVAVRAAPGYSENAVREAIINRLRRRFHVLTGGADGTGYPFGAPLHHSDLMTEVMTTPGVARVEALEAFVDGRSPEDDARDILWRIERRLPQRLVSCPVDDDDAEHGRIVLMPDEVVFIDPAGLMVNVVGAP
ncbi:putative baseplate assembly protein [Paracoccus caeni]|uniref:Baseplate assembly protein n=1 Tax=Paracoccus caeni TaxID=657651 RepID=A0A934SF23_9RHOB|nr:putative baseplate assembly protein [Paracoccus caeni]MBK4216488.1 putative baseplate assembly protein [Paracoccus caeni]